MTGTAVKQPSPRDHLRTELSRFIPSYEKLLPKDASPEKLITGAMIAVTNNPDLLSCTPISIATSVARIAQWNLDIGITAHLVPFGKTCTPIADYKGIILMMLRAGARKVEAHEVRADEEFDYAFGTTPYLKHVPRRGSKAAIIGAYAIAWKRDGSVIFEFVSIEQIDEVRKTKSHSWKNGDCKPWYARKYAVKQLAKYMELTPQLAAVLKDGDEEEELVDLETGEVTRQLLKAPTNRLLEKPEIQTSEAREMDEDLGGEFEPTGSTEA